VAVSRLQISRAALRMKLVFVGIPWLVNIASYKSKNGIVFRPALPRDDRQRHSAVQGGTGRQAGLHGEPAPQNATEGEATLGMRLTQTPHQRFNAAICGAA